MIFKRVVVITVNCFSSASIEGESCHAECHVVMNLCRQVANIITTDQIVRHAD